MMSDKILQQLDKMTTQKETLKKVAINLKLTVFIIKKLKLNIMYICISDNISGLSN